MAEAQARALSEQHEAAATQAAASTEELVRLRSQVSCCDCHCCLLLGGHFIALIPQPVINTGIFVLSYCVVVIAAVAIAVGLCRFAQC